MIPAILRPHRTIPQTPWTGAHKWDLAPKRFLILSAGLILFGLGDSLLIVAQLGNAPWSVLSQGLALQLGITVGTATLLVSALVLAFWFPLGEKPGLGTLMNVLVIAAAIDLGLTFFPQPEEVVIRWLYVFSGIVLVGIGSALYITCGLGSGPRDGWMTALHRKTGIAVGWVRLAIELSVLTLGWLLGGRVGLGTAFFALLVGYSIALAFGVVARLTHR